MNRALSVLLLAVLAACEPVLSDIPTTSPVDEDTDGDGVVDAKDACILRNDPWTSNPDTDHDGDGCRDLGQDLDDDGDAVPDDSDRCPTGELAWTSNTATDVDGDGCRDATEDADADGDGIPDASETCGPGEAGWLSGPTTDRDADGCRDASEDTDDDGDGVADTSDGCPNGIPGWISDNVSDLDGDGCRDAIEDGDDDGDGVLDPLDHCPQGELAWNLEAGADLDGDGCRDATEDHDDDADGIADEADSCPRSEPGWVSAAANDYDGDGCRDATEDEDDDADGRADTVDACPKGAIAWRANGGTDLDEDGCSDAEDLDDDGDGRLDVVDACPLGTPGTGADADGDGCKDGEDLDVDGDGIANDNDACATGEIGWLSARTTDHDGDGCRDATEDDDDDADGVLDLNDMCVRGQVSWAASGGADLDGDGCENNEDSDDDGDGQLDSVDACPLGAVPGGEPLADRDGDGCADGEDSDGDGDGIANEQDSCPLGEVDWRSSRATDHDGDGCRDATEDSDDDSDGVADTADRCVTGLVDWDAIEGALDTDGDGCTDAEDDDDDGDGRLDAGDACPFGATTGADLDGDGCMDDEDADDDGDGVSDATDGCARGEHGWLSSNATDHDGDGCRDATEDSDDDADGLADELDRCAKGLVAWTAGGASDPDADGCDNVEDADDDGDGRADAVDACPLGAKSGADRDADGCVDTEDTDDDDDGVTDALDLCARGETGWSSNRTTDHDGDGCRDATEDGDDDADGVADGVDACARGTVDWDATGGADFDGDGCENNEDTDDDRDGLADTADACPLGAATGADRDNDGCKDSEDLDDDGDTLADTADACPRGEIGWSSNALTDFDTDGCRDATEDTDDDNDGVLDTADACRTGEKGWTSNTTTDRDGDGCRDTTEDTDDDNDGRADAVDACVRGELFVSSTTTDFDGDGCRDAGEDTDDDNDGASDATDLAPLDPRRCSDTDGDSCDDCSVGIDGTGPLSDRDVMNDGPDRDLDGKCDDTDKCPFRADAAQGDADGDGIGDACDGMPELELREPISLSLFGLNSLVPADVDRDGDLDLYASSHAWTTGNSPIAMRGVDRIYWLENDGGDASTWTRRLVTSVAATPEYMSAADIDRDGAVDAVARIGGTGIAWFRNTGRGTTFMQQTIATGVAGLGRLIVADLDGDTDLDVVAGTTAGVVSFINGGNGASWTQVIGIATNYPLLSAGDLDRDGDVDLLSGSGANLDWLENTARNGTAWVRHSVSTVEAGVTGASVADVDRDGVQDIVSGDFGGISADGHLRWHENVAGTGLPWTSRLIANTEQTQALSVADLDADGDIDVIGSFIWLAGGASGVIWYENTATDGLSWKPHVLPTIPGVWHYNALPIDIDLDGGIDILAWSDTDRQGNNVPERLDWYRNRKPHRSALFGPGASTLVNVPGNPSSMYLADTDRDDDLDVVLGLNNGTYLLANQGTAWAGQMVRSDANTLLLGVGDMDGDGDVDFPAYHLFDWWGVLAWLRNDQATVPWTEQALIGFGGSAIGAIGDLSGDGRNDVLSSNGQTVWWDNLSGTGVGIPGKVIYAKSSDKQLTGDLDGDGDLDVIADLYDGTIERPVWFESVNRGASWNLRNTLTGRTGHVSAMEVGDVDRDGDLDVVALTSAGLVVWNNLAGDGSSFREDVVNDLPAAGRLQLVDLDGDRDLDILTPTSEAGMSAWYENVLERATWVQRFTGVTTSHQFFPPGVLTAVADMNRDTAPDIVFAYDNHPSSGNVDIVSLVPNRGAQFALSTTSTAAATAKERASAPVLRIDAAHRGREGDLDAVLAGVRLKLFDGAGAALTAAQAAQRFTRFDLYEDVTAGLATPVFEPGVDALVATAAITRATDAGGLYVAFPAGSTAALFSPGKSKRFWVVPTIAAGASTAPAKTFKVAHLVANGAGRASDARDFMALTLEVPTDVTSTTVTPVP